MKDITGNEIRVLLALFKDFSSDYNANSLSKKSGLTPMGTLKILKRLEKQQILKSRQLGKAVFYKPNLNDYTKAQIKFLLQKEAEESPPRIKMWVKELRKFRETAEIGILFGSILKGEKFNDVDLLLVINKSQNRKVNQLIKEIDNINVKKIHVIRQTKNDLKSNLKNKDRVLLNILRSGIVLFGYEEIIGVVEDVTQ